MTTGCIRQRLIIRSEPAGAEIVLNDARLGTTPYNGPFEWYGWYRLTLEKPGYQRLDDRALLKAPYYFWIPLDLVMELLPIAVRDTKVLSYQLKPKPPMAEPAPPVEGRTISLPEEPATTSKQGSAR